MLVVSERVKARWRPLFESLRTHWCSCMEPMCSLKAGQAETSETECFKPRWKTIFAIINRSGALSAEGSRMDISGSQHAEDAPDPSEELEFAKETAKWKMETLDGRFPGDPLESLKPRGATPEVDLVWPEGSFVQSAEPNGLFPTSFSTWNCDIGLASFARV